MFAKFAIFALFALFASQGLADARHPVKTIDERGAIQDIQGKWTQVVDAVHKLHDDAKAIWEKVKALLQDHAAEIIEEIKTVLGADVKAIVAIAQEIREIVDHALTESSECVVEQAPALQAIVLGTFKHVMSCIVDDILEGTELINNAIDLVIHAIDVVGNFIGDLTSCGLDPVCLVGVVSGALNEIPKIQEQVKELIQSVQDLVSEIVHDTVPCLEDTMQNAASQLQVTIQKIDECVNGVLNE